MAASPFLPSSPRRNRRDEIRRRRRQRAAAALLVAIAVVAAVVAISTGASGGAHHRRAAAHVTGRAHRTAPPTKVAAVRRSPVGLALSSPIFPLGGLGVVADDTVHPGFSEAPSAGILFNLSSGRILWQHNPLTRLRIASLTKMMTALLVVDSTRPREPVFITREAVDMPGSALGVLPLHRHVPVETLLYGLLLPSANDAAVALAQNVSGSVKAFVARMNGEAAKLGMGCTRYSSPSGYYNAHNYSCATDLAMLAHVDLEHPRLARIMSTPTAVLPFPTLKGHKLYLTNNNPLLLYGYPGTTGMKTGYTIEAGACLVATATRHGVSLGVVLLHSPDPGTQAAELLNRAFQGVYHQRPYPDEPAIGAGV